MSFVSDLLFHGKSTWQRSAHLHAMTDSEISL